PFRLVIEEEPCALARRQRPAVDLDAVARRDGEGGAREPLAVDRDAARRDPRLRLAPRAEPGAGDHLGDPLLIWLGLRLAIHGRPCEFGRLVNTAAERRRSLRDANFMDAAFAEAELAARAGEVPVGAVVVREGEFVARAHNRPIAERDA